MEESPQQKAARTTKERHGGDFYSKIAKRSTEGWERNGRKPRGFAAMSPEQRAEISRKGGKASKRPPTADTEVSSRE